MEGLRDDVKGLGEIGHCGPFDGKVVICYYCVFSVPERLARSKGGSRL